MRVLTITSLYPSAAQPTHAVFVENRLRRIVEFSGCSARVIAPVPWFPLSNKQFGTYGKFAATPRHEWRHGIEVSHPRYVVVPKMMTLQPEAFYRSIAAEVARLRAGGYDFDLIDAHYVYPDGVAAARLGASLGKPVIVSARGSDLHQIAHMPGPRKQIQDAFQDMSHMITVSSALAVEAKALGFPTAITTVLRNGVDTDLFKPSPCEDWRAKAGPHSTLVASVGLLIPRKGHDLAIQAIATIPDAYLLIVGTGPDRQKLEDLAASLGVADRVEFTGAVPHEELPRVYSAADMLLLATYREGWPNVVLEAMACGAPVVATNIGAIPEIIVRDELGVVVPERTAGAIAAGICNIVANPRDRAHVRAHAVEHGWGEVVAAQTALYEHVAGLGFRRAA